MTAPIWEAQGPSTVSSRSPSFSMPLFPGSFDKHGTWRSLQNLHHKRMGEGPSVWGTGYHIHTLCSLNKQLPKTLLYGVMIAKGASEEAEHWEFHISHAVHCRDWEPQLGAVPAITAERRGITREGTISITQAELDQKKMLFPKVYQSSRIFFFFFSPQFLLWVLGLAASTVSCSQLPVISVSALW